jgi:hypothetical protein
MANDFVWECHFLLLFQPIQLVPSSAGLHQWRGFPLAAVRSLAFVHCHVVTSAPYEPGSGGIVFLVGPSIFATIFFIHFVIIPPS